MTKDSDNTPRTDNFMTALHEAGSQIGASHAGGKLAAFARQLERELAEAKRDADIQLRERGLLSRELTALKDADVTRSISQGWYSTDGKKPERRWIGEDMPQDSIDVLVCGEYGGCRVAHYDYADRNWWEDRIKPLSGVTHWMPLPEPPKEGK